MDGIQAAEKKEETEGKNTSTDLIYSAQLTRADSLPSFDKKYVAEPLYATDIETNYCNIPMIGELIDFSKNLKKKMKKKKHDKAVANKALKNQCKGNVISEGRLSTFHDFY